MNKFRIAISGTFSILVSACVIQTSSQTPSVNATPGAVTAIFTGEPLKYASPTPSVSLISHVVLPTPIVFVSPSPTVSPSLTPTPQSTWPPDVVSKNLSFVDWPEYPGVQFFRGTGKGIESLDRTYIGGLEVFTGTSSVNGGLTSGDLVAKIDLKYSDGGFPAWGEMKFDATQELWTISPRAHNNCFSDHQECFTENYNGYDTVVDDEYGYDEDKKVVELVPEFIPGSFDPVKLPLSDLDNAFLEKDTLRGYVNGLSRWYRGVHFGVDEENFFTRSITVGQKALYLVLPNGARRTLTLYAFLLPNLDRVVEFDIPFIDKSGFHVEYTNGIGTVRYPYDIIVLRYHPVSKKLYLFIENIPKIRDEGREIGMLVQVIPHFVTHSTPGLGQGFIMPQLFRFDEEYVLK